MDGDQIVPSAKIRTRKKIGMATTRTNYNRKHHLSQKYKGPKQGALKLSTTKSPKNLQKPNQETQIDRYLSQTKICKQWEAEMERLNTKYNLDCFSDSELDLESDEENSISVNMGMKHSSKLRVLFIVQEFVILLPCHDP